MDEVLTKLIDYCLKLLARRPYSKSEIDKKLTQYLYKRKVNQPDIYKQEVLGLLKKENFINDTDFAKWFVEQREEFRPRSKKALYYELMQKGIDRDLIERTLEDYNEQEAIKKIISRKSHLPPQKLISYLLSQGFSYDEVKNAVNEN